MNKPPKHRFIFGILSIGLVLVLGIVAYTYNQKKKFNKVPVTQGHIEEAIYGLGKVKAIEIFEAKPGIISSIRHLHVKEGQLVIKGERLIDFDEGSKVLAPFQGTVTNIPFHEGENVFPQTVVLRVENLKQLYVEVSLEQQGALRVYPGQSARLSFESLRGVLAKGLVQSIFPKDDQFIVKIRVDQLPPEILPAMTADVAIEVGRRENVTLIPDSAVSNGSVTVIRDGKKQKVPVKLGIIDGTQAELIEGDVKPGDEVLVRKE
jgi:macrolide-specific efflux system membrane fusion protein